MPTLTIAVLCQSCTWIPRLGSWQVDVFPRFSPMISHTNHHTCGMVTSNDKNEHRWLRITTVLAFFPAIVLLLPYGIISARPLPTVGIAVMFFSATFSTLVLGGGVHSPGTRACGDLLLAASIMAILIPRCVERVCSSDDLCMMLY
jgi:hypothetical protein